MVGGALSRVYSAVLCLSHSLTCLLKGDVASNLLAASLYACYQARWQALQYCINSSVSIVYTKAGIKKLAVISVQQTHHSCRAHVCISDITRDAMSCQINNAVYCQLSIAVYCQR